MAGKILKCVVMSFLGLLVFVQPAITDCIHHGDVNLDGGITAADAQRAFFLVLGLFYPTYDEECAADCTGDGSVTAADAQAIFLVVLGLGDCADPLVTPTPPPHVPGFAYIRSGTYMRGSPDNESCRASDETQHQVTLTSDFYIMTSEVTRLVWADLKAAQPTLPNDPSLTMYSPTMYHPVQMVSWYEVILFANLMSVRDGLTRCYYKDAGFTIPVDATNYTSGSFYCQFNADGYQLPTEAQWEWAARAGTTGPFSADESNYSSGTCMTCSPDPPLNVLDSIAWWCGNAENTAYPVGEKLPNPWGLYDMYGNVGEWCWDWYDSYPMGPLTDPAGPSTGSDRVKRGGHWSISAQGCRSASRGGGNPGGRNCDVGFRLARSVVAVF